MGAMGGSGPIRKIFSNEEVSGFSEYGKK